MKEPRHFNTEETGRSFYFGSFLSYNNADTSI